MQRSAPLKPENLGKAEADLLAMAEHSKQKYLDIVGRLQKESLKSDTAVIDQSVQSVEDHEETMDSVSEDEESHAENEEEEEEPLTIRWKYIYSMKYDFLINQLCIDCTDGSYSGTD